MPWLKVDDGEWCAPWVMIAGAPAYGLYVRLAGYCAQNLTDGLVPAPIVAMLTTDAGGREQLDKLASVDKVEIRSTGSVVLLDYLESNISAAQWQYDQESRKARAQKAAAARWDKNGRPDA